MKQPNQDNQKQDTNRTAQQQNQGRGQDNGLKAQGRNEREGTGDQQHRSQNQQTNRYLTQFKRPTR